MFRPTKKDNLRFFVVLDEKKLGTPSQIIFVDRITNVQYCLFDAGNSIAVTLLLNQDGKPLLYQPPDEDDSCHILLHINYFELNLSFA